MLIDFFKTRSSNKTDSQKVRQPAGEPPASSKKAQSDFQITCLQLFEMIDGLFTDTVVTCHHEKLPNNLIVDGEINCRSGFHSRQIAPAHCRVRNPAYNTGVISDIVVIRHHEELPNNLFATV